jgi:hypothetical protein
MSRSSARALTLAAGLAVAGCTPAQVRYQRVVSPAGTAEPVEATLFLIGDAGEINEHSTAVLAHLSRNIDAVAAGDATRPVIVAFLGDNIYELGARAEHEASDLAIIQAQVDALGRFSNVRGVFVPGNHDWSKGGADEQGRLAVRLQEDWVSRLSADRHVDVLPSDACPGPAGFDIGPSLRLLFLDTEWLLRQPADDCGSAQAFYERLARDLEANRGKRVVVMSHHPLASGGLHGGHVHPFQNGPLVFYAWRKLGWSVQDLMSSRYSAMIRGLEGAFAASGTRPLLHAAGHDHSLQVVRRAGVGQPAYQLVSGAGSRSTNSRRMDGTRYATNGFGYMRVDLRASGAHLTVYARPPEGGAVEAVFACTLTDAAPESECPEAPLAEAGR